MDLRGWPYTRSNLVLVYFTSDLRRKMRFVSMPNMLSMISMTSMINIMYTMTMIMDLGFVAPLNVKVHLFVHGFNPAYLHGPLQVRHTLMHSRIT